MNKIYKNNQNGVVAILTLLAISVIALGIMTTMSVLAASELKMSGSESASEKTFYAAETGINEGLYQLAKSPVTGEFCTDFLGATLPCSSSQSDKVTVTISPAPDHYQRIITSTAKDSTGKVRTVSLTAQTSSYANSFKYAVMSGQGGFIMMKSKVIGGAGDGVYANGNVIGQSTDKSVIEGTLRVAEKIPAALGPKEDPGTAVADIPFSKISIPKAAQSFKIPDSLFPQGIDQLPLNKINLYLKKSSFSVDDVKISIVRNFYDTVNNIDIPSSNSNDVVIESQIPKASVGNNYPDATQPDSWKSWPSVSFENNGVIKAGPPLYKSETYWIVLTSNTLNNSRYYTWGLNTIDDYTDGQAEKFATSWGAENKDFAFYLTIGMSSDTYAEQVKVTGGDVNLPDYESKDVYAHKIDTVDVDGGAYCITSINSNPCISASNQPQMPFPISQTDINTIKTAILSTCPMPTSADKTITTHETFNGPTIINGNLVLSGQNARLTLKENLWVTGNIQLDHPNQILELDTTLNDLSGMVIADGKISVSNNAIIAGACHEYDSMDCTNSKSFIIMISQKYSASISDPAIDADNNSKSVIYYAPSGLIDLKKGYLRNATGFVIKLSVNAAVEYNNNIQFIALPPDGSQAFGPIGGTWQEK